MTAADERADARGSRHTATPNCVKTSSDEPMKSYIRIAPDVEYFTDYDRFREAQICCAVAEDGTSLFSRIENRRFMHTARHDLSERVIELLCRQIHREICTLHYGGQAVE